MDAIHLTKIRCYGYLGNLPEEQVLGQWFEVNVTLWLDLSPAGKSDNLQDTVNYCTIISTVQNLVKTSRFALIERLADAIAQAILQQPLVQQVKINVSKLAAPIPDFNGKVTVEITRTKNSN